MIVVLSELLETMDKALMQYVENSSTRYDGKEYAAIKIKLRVWTSVVVNPCYKPLQKKRRKATAAEKPEQCSECQKK